MRLWLNGRIEDEKAAWIAPDDRGLLLADGLYETLRIHDGRPLRLDAHLERLRKGALLFELPLPDVDLAAAMTDVLEANALAEGSLRLTLTRGPAPRGLAPPTKPRPTLLITAAPPAPLTPPVRCIVATVTRRNPYSPVTRAKTLAAADSVLARIEASRLEADDAILLTIEGYVAEASAANLFAVIDGRLVTPPATDGCLPGVVRADLLRLGAIEERLTPDRLADASEIFLSSALGLRPVRELVGRDGPELVNDAADRLVEQLFPPG